MLLYTLSETDPDMSYFSYLWTLEFTMIKPFLNFSVLQTVTFHHEDLEPGLNFDHQLKAMLPDIWKSVSATIAGAGGYKVNPLLKVNLKDVSVKTTHHHRQSIGFSVVKRSSLHICDFVSVYVYNAITPIHAVVVDLELFKTR